MQSEISIDKHSNTANYDMFEQSEYLHNSFKKLKGKTLDYTGRNGNHNSTEINNITDLYKIIQHSVKFP